VASLLGLCDENTYEGEAALRLMSLAMSSALASSEQPDEPSLEFRPKMRNPCPFSLAHQPTNCLLIDWRPAIREVLGAILNGDNTADIAYQFHLGLASVASRKGALLAKTNGCGHVVFTGGVWQNPLLCQLAKYYFRRTNAPAAERTEKRPLQFYFSLQTPPNDSSLALGQVVAAGFCSADGA
jgi:hydrogenase maturation protein HypF